MTYVKVNVADEFRNAASAGVVIMTSMSTVWSGCSVTSTASAGMLILSHQQPRKETDMLRIMFAVIGVVLSGCQTTPAPESAKSEVQLATQAWVAAFNECNVSRLAALYASEAVLWGTLSPTLISTPAGVRGYFDRACAASPPFKVTVGEQLVRIYGDTAISSGGYVFAREVQGQVRSLPARYSFTYRKVDGHWRIADHHSSAVPAPPQPASTPSR